MHILPAAEKKSTGVKGVEETGAKTVKGEKDKKRKENAGKEFNWSMLYMNVRVLYFIIAIQSYAVVVGGRDRKLSG